MKSKISFFNKTIFLKNITLYWPIWAGYLIVLLFMQPIMLWSNFEYGKYYDVYTTQMKFEDAVDTISISLNGWVIVFAAVIIAMALYSYIYNAKSANMIHALPVDKTQLFGTNVISGLVFLIVPQIITALVSIGVCLSFGMTRVEIIGLWLVESVAIAFVAFAFASCCAMFTGLLVALPIYVFVINFLPSWVYYMVYLVVNVYAHGASHLSHRISHIAQDVLAPMSSLARYIGLEEIYENEICVGLEIYGGKLLAVYVVLAILLYALAYFTYKKRHIEKAGEWITVEWLKPVFRFIVGMSAGIYGGLMIRILFDQFGIIVDGIGFVILMLVLGGFGYFLAEMIVRKNFHVFQKKNWLKCAVFSVILLLSYGGMLCVADMTEKFVPEKDEVEKVSLYMGYDIVRDGEEAEQFIELHKKIIENIDLIEERAETLNYENAEYWYVSITYNMKNGDYVDRHYSLFGGDEEIDEIIKEISVLENDPENFLQNNLCKRYDEVVMFYDSTVEAQFVNSKHNVGIDNPFDYVYETLEFTPEQTKELYEAVIADVRAGTLMKYNVSSYWAHMEDKMGGTINLYLNYQDPEEGNVDNVYSSDSSVFYETGEYVIVEPIATAYLNIGKDCENVLNKLIEFGAIQSVEDIYWGEVHVEHGEDLYIDADVN